MSVEAANLFGFAISMALYGVVLAMFSQTIQPLWRDRYRRWVVLWFTISSLALSTVNAVLIIIYNYKGWIQYRDYPGTLAYFSDQTSTVITIRYVFMVIVGVAGDLLIIWRVYYVWGRQRKIIILPCVVIIVELIVWGIICMMWFRNYSLTGPYKNQYIVLEILGYLTTIAENVGCTAMIIGRIWWVGRDSPNPTMRKKYKAIIMALAESGMLYTVTLLVWSVLSTVPEWIVIGDFFGYIYTMIASIAPLLILLLIVKSRRSTGGGAIGRGAKMIHKAKSGPLAGRPAPSQVHDIGAISTDIEFRPTQ